ncbi:MAG: phosphotransferase [Candidatus Pacebacteria bacterium]|nr:phosphotransferase [Candidatus Paceibacterota bacterium]
MSVTFLNEPRIDSKIPEKSILLRNNSKDLIISVCYKNKNLLGDDVLIEYFYEGLISVVVKITNAVEKNNKFVLKIRGGNGSSKEAAVFEYWKSIGAKVPNVYVVGNEGDLSYFIMEFIDGKNLKESSKDGLYSEGEVAEILGRLQADLHSGQLKEDTKIPKDLKDSISNHAETTERNFYKELGLTKLEELDIFPKVWFIGIDKAFKNIIDKEQDEDTNIILGHMDFSSYNIFAGPPQVITDPNPALCLPVVDLAHTLVMAAHTQSILTTYVQDILSAYEKQTGSKVDMDLLKDAFVVEAITKISYWFRVNNTDSKYRLEPYLKALLEEGRFPWELQYN